ncbi:MULTISPECIES: helix-turn-helix domain-containing protein [Streptomyces]|uniref:helix-turn-helix domain-containing protein n=1 Tax=Streptomyces TaxID=1883 RepID=UPI00345B6D08
MDHPQHDAGSEDLAQLIKSLMDDYKVNQSEIARRIGVHVSTVNTWVHRKRGQGRGPSADVLRNLSQEFPRYSEERVFAAAGRKRPGPLAAEDERELLELFKGLTEEQQEFTKTQIRALVESNRTTLS